MARRPAVGHGSNSAVQEEVGARSLASASDPWDVPDKRRGRRDRGGRRWGGSGGRWWIWVGRAILWALLLVILVNGVRAPFERFTADDSGGTRTPKTDARAQFPSSGASAFALQFATVYLNYDEKTATQRERELKSFLPDGADAQFGWNGVGRLQVASVQVAGVDARDANNAVVTVLARSQDKWLRLAVPVYAKDGALVIAGRPALLPPPIRASLPSKTAPERDAPLEAELQPILDGFFKAYATSDQTSLARFSDRPGLTGLAKSVNYVSLKEVNAPKGAADQRTVTATVAWQIAAAGPTGGGGELEQAYELSVVKKDGKWYVRDIRALTEPTTP